MKRRHAHEIEPVRAEEVAIKQLVDDNSGIMRLGRPTEICLRAMATKNGATRLRAQR